MAGYTFDEKMAKQLPGTIVFCGHKRSAVKPLMVGLLEYLLFRPQMAEDADEVQVEIYTASPDPVYFDLAVDPRVHMIVTGFTRSGCPSAKLLDRASSQTRPETHLIVVLQDMEDYMDDFFWNKMMEHAANFNVSLLIHSNVAPRPPTLGSGRVEDLTNAAILARWDASSESRERMHSTFATSFCKKEGWDQLLQRLTNDPITGAGALVIEYGGTNNIAYGVPSRTIARQKQKC